MIDWFRVGGGALWVAGLGLALAALSRGHWLAVRQREPLLAILDGPAYQATLDGGLLLVSLGLLLRARSTGERLACALVVLVCAALAALEWRRTRLAPQDPGPEERLIPQGAVSVGTGSLRTGEILTWLRRLELWWVLAALPLLIFPGRLAPWALASLALLWIVRRIVTGHLTVRTPVDWPLLVLALMLPVAVWAAADRSLAVVALYRIAGGLALFYAVANWVSSWRRLAACSVLWVLTGAGLAVLALLTTTTWGLPKMFDAGPVVVWLQDHGHALIAEDVNANVLAGGLAIVWPASAALLFARSGGPAARNAWIRAGLAACLLWVTAVLVLTQSRGALLAVAVAAAFMAMVYWPRLRLCLPVAGLVLLLWLARGGSAQLSRMANMLFSGGAVTSLSGRQEVWSRAIAMVEDFAFTGIGLGTFDWVQPRLYPFFLVSGPVHHAHNLLLQVGIDLGLPGLVAYLALLVGAFYATWRAYLETRLPAGPHSSTERVEENGFLNHLALGLLGGQVALFVHGLLDAATWGNKVAILPWFMLGLAMAVANLTAGGSHNVTTERLPEKEGTH